MEGSRDFIGRLDPPIRCCRQTLENFSIVCRRFPKKKEKKSLKSTKIRRLQFTAPEIRYYIKTGTGPPLRIIWNYSKLFVRPPFFLLLASSMFLFSYSFSSAVATKANWLQSPPKGFPPCLVRTYKYNKKKKEKYVEYTFKSRWHHQLSAARNTTTVRIPGAPTFIQAINSSTITRHVDLWRDLNLPSFVYWTCLFRLLLLFIKGDKSCEYNPVWNQTRK